MSWSSDRLRHPARVLRGVDASGLHGPAQLAVPSATALASLVGPSSEPAPSPERLAAERADGYAEGYAAGHAAAVAAAEAARERALEHAAARLAEAAAAAATSRAALAAEVTADAIELTYGLARTILGADAIAGSLPPRAAVARALSLAPEGEDLVVRVPPTCEITAADLAGLCDTGRISIRVDPAVEAGGCIVEAGACRIDTQISTALERVGKVLTDLRSPGAPRAPLPGEGNEPPASVERSA